MSRWFKDGGPRLMRVAGWSAAALALAGLQWLGDALVAWGGWSVPGSLVGLLILLGLLTLRGGVPPSLDEITTPLLQHLMLFLIPSVAAVGLYVGLLSQHLVVFVLAATLVTALTIAATGWTLHRLMRRRQP